MKRNIFVKLSYLAVLSILYVTSSCSNEDEIPPTEEQHKKTEEVEISKPLTDSLTPSEVEELNNVNASQYKLFKAIVSESAPEENVICSPLSAQMALSLASIGAEEDVADEIATALGVRDIETLHSANNKIINSLPNVHENTTVNIANSFWYDTKYNLFPGFLEKLTSAYNLDVFTLPFEKETTRVQINKWCSDNTEGKIDEILRPGEKLEDFSFINATYFNSPWTKEFDEKSTRDMPFYGLVKTSNVPMMWENFSSTKAYREKETNLRAVGISAGKDAFEVTFIMPPVNQSIDDFIQSDFESVLEKMQDCNVTVIVPRFSLYPSTRVLSRAMNKFGIEKLFTKGLTQVVENKKIPIDFFQKVAMEINEKGAKAAAISWVMSGSAGGGELFEFNRPFVVLVRENSTGIVLFAGKVVDL